MYPQQDPYSQQNSYPQQHSYPQQNSYPQQTPYPQQQNAYSQPYPYPQQPPYMQQGQNPYSPYANTPQRNRRARTAMIDGIISIALSFITLFTLVGFAGLITGTLAIVYGFIGLKQAKILPNNAGRGQAITGIVLGFIAWFLVIISFLIRSAAGV